MIGQEIKGFEIKRQLSEGSMTVVYLGENNIGKQVAIKVLKTEYFHNAQVHQYFIQKAKIMAKLNHENICSVISLEDNSEYCAIVMEYLQGEDLDSYMHRHGAVAGDWLGQIAPALDYAHGEKIVHRDLKPSNFFLTSAGKIKVMDFGIAELSDSLIYMSPEQIQSPKYVDYKTDIYSLGVTLHHLLSGSLPYDTTTSSDYQIMKQITEQELPPLAVPKAISDLIQWCTSKDPSKRPDSVMALLQTNRDQNSRDATVVDTESSISKETTKYTEFPKTKSELQSLVNKAIAKDPKVDLNYIDTSLITDMSELFKNKEGFNGDISGWDVSQVTDMGEMFSGAILFTSDLSSWDVSKVTKKTDIFTGSGIARDSSKHPRW